MLCLAVGPAKQGSWVLELHYAEFTRLGDSTQLTLVFHSLLRCSEAVIAKCIGLIRQYVSRCVYSQSGGLV